MSGRNCLMAVGCRAVIEGGCVGTEPGALSGCITCRARQGQGSASTQRAGRSQGRQRLSIILTSGVFTRALLCLLVFGEAGGRR